MLIYERLDVVVNMDSNNEINSHAGKIRTRNSKSRRNNPYAKRSRGLAQKSDQVGEEENRQGILKKVTNYFVPNWVSSWWNPNEYQNKDAEEISSESEDSGEDERSASPIVTKVDSFRFHEHHVSQTAKLIHNKPVQSTALKPTIKGFYSSEKLADNTINQPSFLGSPKLLSTFKTPALTNIISQSSGADTYKKEYVSSDVDTTLNKPTFNITAFVAPSNISRTATKTFASPSSAFDFSANNRSLFYRGQTKFGGASTQRWSTIKRQKMSPVSDRSSTTSRTQMRAKPLLSARKRDAITSETAKRILNTLDKMSSPVKDSRRLPSVKHLLASPLTFSQQLKNTSTTKKVEGDCMKPPVSAMSISKTFTGFNTSLTNTNNEVLPIPPKESKPAEKFSFATASTAQPLNNANKEFAKFSSVNKDIIFKDTNVGLSPRVSGKIRREKANIHYTSKKSEDSVNTLPNVTQVVPLAVNSVPKFNFFPKKTDTKPTTIKDNTIKSDIFKFADPNVISARTLLGEVSEMNFDFSSPVNIRSKSKECKSESAISADSIIPTFPNGTGSFAKTSDKNLVVSKSTVAIRTLSSKLAPAPDSWECKGCLLRNEAGVSECVACEGKKPNARSLLLNVPQPSKLPPPEKVKSLALKFSKPEGCWDCSACLLTNKCEAVKCIACETSKPGASNADQVISKPSVQQRKLKLPPADPDAWSCPVCMVKNKKEDSSCVCCGEKKVGYEDTNERNVKKEQEFSLGSSKPAVSFGSSKPVTFGSSKPVTFGSSKPAVTFGSSKPAVSFGSSKPVTFGSSKSVSFGGNDSADVFKPITSAPGGTSFVGETRFGKSKSETSFSFGQHYQENKFRSPKVTENTTPAISQSIGGSSGSKPSQLSSIADAARSGFLTVSDSPSKPQELAPKKETTEDVKLLTGNGAVDTEMMSTPTAAVLSNLCTKNAFPPKASAEMPGSFVFGEKQTDASRTSSSSTDTKPSFNFAGSSLFSFGANGSTSLASSNIVESATSASSFGAPSIVTSYSVFGATSKPDLKTAGFSFGAVSSSSSTSSELFNIESKKPLFTFGKSSATENNSHNFGGNSDKSLFGSSTAVDSKSQTFGNLGNNTNFSLANSSMQEGPSFAAQQKPSGGFKFDANPTANFNFTSDATQPLFGFTFNQPSTMPQLPNGAVHSTAVNGDLFAVGKAPSTGSNGRRTRRAVRKLRK